MVEMTLAKMRDSSRLVEADEILHIINGRKREDVGYFIPMAFGREFREFFETIEQKKKTSLLIRVANANRKDPIGDGAAGDNIG